MAKEKSKGLSTFGGVFTPSILTILGIILFMRHGWVVGSVGLLAVLAMIALAHTVAILTSLSLAALATNGPVKAGGDYFLVSRSLGPEFGGALGAMLFLAQSVSVAFYTLGFGEILSGLMPDSFLSQAVVPAMLAAGCLFVLAMLGADAAIRFQYLIMASMSAALLSFVLGGLERADFNQLRANLWPPESGPEFWVVFAIFFPAVTGFTQGVSMSGDLKNPSRSLPSGTFAAIAVSLIVYTGTALLFASGAPLSDLSSDFLAFKHFSQWPLLVDVGVMAATLSSALASFLGAPRILQALSRDGIFPALNGFGKGQGASDNPRRAVCLSAVIVLVVYTLGDLNAIAKLISMFFLISYGLLNWATYIEAVGDAPSFRPRYKYFHRWLSLLGALICFAAMIAIDALMCFIAVIVLGSVYWYLRRQELQVDWIDSRPAYFYRKLKETLLEINRVPSSPWTWQPNILIFSKNSNHRKNLLRFANALIGESGLASVVRIFERKRQDAHVFAECREQEDILNKEIAELDSRIQALALATPDLSVAIDTLLQSYGIGPVKANSVLMDWNEQTPDEQTQKKFAHQLQSIARLHRHILLFSGDKEACQPIWCATEEAARIDVWWWGTASCRLALLLAFLISKHREQEDSEIRILAPCKSNTDEKERAHIKKALKDARIKARIEMVPDATEEDMCDRSQDALLLLFRIEVEGMRVTGPFGEELTNKLMQMPPTCMVYAAESVRLTRGDEQVSKSGANK